MKSARHHWWPMGVSASWKDDDGLVSWLRPSGEVKKLQPINLGVIGNGHHVKLSKDDNDPTPWDFSFEQVFDKADDAFPSVIAWLASLADARRSRNNRPGIFEPEACTDDQLKILSECLVSLAVRSPMNREAAVGLAERFRGPLPTRERNALIGMNMRNTQETATKELGARGKFVLVLSPDAEFIFGDGFFHTIRSPYGAGLTPKIFAPLTPNIAVLYVRPTQYSTEPKLMSYVADAPEVKLLNQAIQVYAGQFIFFRRERPELLDCYKGESYQEYTGDNPVDRLIRRVPGTTSRNMFLANGLDQIRWPRGR